MNIPLLDREDPPTTLEVDSRRATTGATSSGEPAPEVAAARRSAASLDTIAPHLDNRRPTLTTAARALCPAAHLGTA